MKKRYVDVFLIPVPKDRLEEYREISEISAKVWMDHGALEYVENMSEDVKDGEHTSFPMAVKKQDNEIIFLSWIVYESRGHRDQVNDQAMNDSRLAHWTPDKFPFDGKRLIWGGFENFSWYQKKM